MLERLELPPWLKAGLALPLLVLNLWVLRQLLLPLAPFPALFFTAALIAFLLDIPSRWLRERGLPRALVVPWCLARWVCWCWPALAGSQADRLIQQLSPESLPPNGRKKSSNDS